MMSAPRDNRQLDRILLAAYRDQQGRLMEPGHHHSAMGLNSESLPRVHGKLQRRHHNEWAG